MLLVVLDEDELELDDVEPMQVVHGRPVETLVEQELVLVAENETLVAQGIYRTLVEVEQRRGGHVVSQSQTVTASAGVQ